VTHVGNGKLLAYLAARGEVISTQYSEDKVSVHCRIPQKYLGKIDLDTVEITPHSNGCQQPHQQNTQSLGDI